MTEYRRCEYCFHFVSTGMDGECHKRAPEMPGLHGSSRWPSAGRIESCGDWLANIDYFVRQLESARETIAELTEENEHLRHDVEGLKGDLDTMIAQHVPARKSLPVVETTEEVRA